MTEPEDKNEGVHRLPERRLSGAGRWHSLGRPGGRLQSGIVDGIVEEIIEAIKLKAEDIENDVNDDQIEYGVFHLKSLCDLLEDTLKSAKIRDELRQIDEEFRDKIRGVIGDWDEVLPRLRKMRRKQQSSA
jgi:hypothetical protein